ncbi:PLP-dependent aminotransferase family protein [Alcaligenes endophyticus]|uniref:PLP-dependent aminotransferase family protein n=1 Tax=Alcaligenes endophyticus TaxID=1929088 RepID=A0ABT8EGH7_9BURK|nr:PLP-dependent aminotransferase family protein [Alcaligenes endophyticus]MCX5589938.1 PLP-dependent aminotransferase family protein [Alcaligenes endophyticus]MDN4120399.1 PLP-dependent aminotransferase family protein [Alcaligenes endophyticus]
MLEIVLHESLLQHLDRDSDETLVRQIYRACSRLILEGSLPAGTKLPASRALARDMQVSRNTILNAYEQLHAEGYVVTHTGSGTYVSNLAPSLSRGLKPPPMPIASPTESNISGRGRRLLGNTFAAKRQWGPFVPGVPDVTLFPSKVWMRLQRRYWNTLPPSLLTYAHGAGYYPLRRAVSEHLRVVRAVVCEPEQVIITSGIHQSISVLTHLLSDVGDRVWMENPGYWGASSMLRAGGLQLEPVEVTVEGMSPSAEQLQQPPQLIFVTPSHQYPLGHVMSLPQRLMLLEYAQRHQCWIIEDDYDSEFRFDGRPIPSLQGLDQYGRVLYLGTFSKTLFPGMRLAYMVVPKALTDWVARALSELYREGRLLEQATLTDFIAEGYYAQHIRKTKTVYARRQSILREALSHHFGRDWPMSNHEAGLHLVLHLPAYVNDVALANAAQAQGIWVRPLSSYYVADAKPGLLFGYASVSDEQILPSLQRLLPLIDRALATA